MPTTDIPPPGRAAGTASRCRPLPRALRLLREVRERPRSPSVRESRAGASELRRWSRPPAPRRRACLAASARARSLLATAVRRPQPAVTALCACALGPGRREPPVGCGSAASPSAAPVSARQRLAAQRRVPEGTGKGGGRGAAETGGAGGRATPGEAKRSPGNRRGGRGRGDGGLRLSGARLSAQPPASPRRRNPQHRPPAPILPRSPRAAACSLTCRPRRPNGLTCGSPRGASSRLFVRWSPLCGAPATPASQPPRCARPWPLTLSANAVKALLLGVDLLPSELQKRGRRGPRAACALGQVLHLRRLLLSVHIPARTPFFLL